MRDPIKKIREVLDGVNDFLSTPYTKRSSITKCPRCHASHHDLEFKKFLHPSGENTHWATCPNTAEPLFAALKK